jgi:homoserine kinase
LKLTVRVPATVANLGPGFDSFGLALSLFNEIEVDTEGEPSVEIDGEGGGELPRDDSNLVLRSMRALADATGHELPPLAVACTNRIPLERGLGSSAAAVVGGLTLASHLLEGPVPGDRVLELAVELEGHPDNVGAALRGGATITFFDGEHWRVQALSPADDLRPVILLPEAERVRTEEARRVLPEQVDRTDAVFNASRAGLLVLALTGQPDLLPVALQDRLHQDARLALAPGAKAVFLRMKEAGVPICVAGSGPTLLAFETGAGSVPDPGEGWRTLRLPVARTGASVLEQPHADR